MPSELQESVDSAWEQSLSGQNSLPLADVKDMLDQVGIKLPNHKVRDVVQDLKNKGETEGEFLSKSGFEKLCQNLTEGDVAKTFKTSRTKERPRESSCLNP